MCVWGGWVEIITFNIRGRTFPKSGDVFKIVDKEVRCSSKFRTSGKRELWICFMGAGYFEIRTGRAPFQMRNPPIGN